MQRIHIFSIFIIALSTVCFHDVTSTEDLNKDKGPPDTLKSLEDAIAKLEKADKAFPDIVFANGHLVTRPPQTFPAFPNPGARPMGAPPRLPPPTFHFPPPQQSMAAKIAASQAAAAAAAAAQKKRMQNSQHGENGEIAKAQTRHGDDCTFELDGARYDLNALRLSVGQAEYIAQDPSRMIYKINVCGVATTPASDCQRSNGMICQYDQGPAPILEVIARWNAAPYPIWSYIDENFKDAGVKLSFRNGDDCSFRGMKKTREAVINFACDKEAGKMGPMSVQEISTCNYVVTIPTSLSCWDAAETTSFGWYFIFFVLIAAAAYLGLGIAYNRTKLQKTGIEAIPHLEFWKDLPGLVKDGVAFTWSKFMCYTCRQAKAENDL